eukprot:664512-Hanusia_phi.AAC.2
MEMRDLLVVERQRRAGNETGSNALDDRPAQEESSTSGGGGEGASREQAKGGRLQWEKGEERRGAESDEMKNAMKH